jgi:predicted XRE-type DNA-binding protein
LFDAAKSNPYCNKTLETIMTKLQFDNIFDAVVADKAEAADLEFRADLMLVVRQLLSEKGLDQKTAAELFGVKQPRISELMRGKVNLCSSEKLIKYLAHLGYKLKPNYQPHETTSLAVSVVRGN